MTYWHSTKIHRLVLPPLMLSCFSTGMHWGFVSILHLTNHSEVNCVNFLMKYHFWMAAKTNLQIPLFVFVLAIVNLFKHFNQQFLIIYNHFKVHLAQCNRCEPIGKPTKINESHKSLSCFFHCYYIHILQIETLNRLTFIYL